MSDQEAYDLETLLRELREVIDAARTMPHVGVGAREPGGGRSS